MKRVDPIEPPCPVRRSAVLALLLSASGCGGGSDPAAPPAAPKTPVPVPPQPAPAPPPAAARVWHVDPAGGSDTAEGTPAAPRRTLPALRGGERVLIRRGTTLIVPGDYDPAADDVEFDGYLAPGDAADAPKPIWTLSGTRNFIVWTGNNNGVVFRNLRFVVPFGQTGRPAIRLSATVPIRVGLVMEDCDVTGDDGALVGLISADYEALTLRRCTFTCARAASFSHGASGCVFIKASGGAAAFAVTNMLWEGNRISNPSGPGMQIRSGSPTDDNAGRFAGKFVNATLRGNRFGDCGTTGVFLVCGFHGGVKIPEAGRHYGWDGLVFEDNVIENNGGSGASIGPNLADTERRTVIQRNRVWNNGHRNGTTGGLQLMGLSRALIQDNDCRDNWTTSDFDGVNLFLDIIDAATSAMQTSGAVGCVVRRNYCSGARGAGGADFAAWLAQQNPNSSNAPSSGIRVYFGRGNFVYANVLVDNGSGIACDKSADNVIFNNTIRRCTMGFYDGVGLATRGTRFFNNVTVDCDWDHYGLGLEGWTEVLPSTAEIRLDALDGHYVGFTGNGQFALVRDGVHGRNFFIRETADAAGTLGLAVVSWRDSEHRVNATVLRPFSALVFAAGALSIGSMEPYAPSGRHSNARHGARVGSLRQFAPGAGDVTADPLLGTGGAPLAGSPLLGAGAPLPASPFDEITDAARRAFRSPPSIGAFEA
jgi:parallel beta-helix repeat protein